MPWNLLIPVIGQLFDKIFPDEAKANEAKAKLIELQMNGELQKITGQLEVNKAEASNPNLFVAGWRPAIGWVCAASLGFYYIPQFIMASFLWSRLALEMNSIPEYPVSQISGLTELVFALLGLATLRTVEKARRVTK